MSQKGPKIPSELIYVDYNVCREKIVKWCDEHGTKRDKDFFNFGIHFALSMACSNYIKFGIDITPSETNALELCMEIIEKYKITDVFMDMDNIDYMFLKEYEVWNNPIN